MNDNMEFKALPGSLAYYCIVGNLRSELKYRSREAMGRNWSTVFEGEILPEDHQEVAPDVVRTFVTAISKPQRGRPGSITGAAQSLLKILNAIEQGVRNFPAPEKDVIEPGNDLSNPLDIVINPIKTTPDVSDDFQKKFWAWLSKFVSKVTKLDMVFMVTIGVADYGLTFLLGEMGLVAATVYTMISLHALGMAKERYSKRTANTGIAAVVVLELGAFFIHLTMFNMRIWARITDMPFRVDDVASEHRPFYIALVLAVLLSAAGIYAVNTTLSLLVERNNAEEFESDHVGRKW